MNNPVIKNQVLLTSLCHPTCAEKYQDDLRNNSCDLVTPEVHDEVSGRCRTSPDILPLRFFQLSHFPHTTVTPAELQHRRRSQTSALLTAVQHNGAAFSVVLLCRVGGGGYDIGGEREWVRDRQLSSEDLLVDCWNSAEKLLQELLASQILTKNHLRSHQTMGGGSRSSC